MFKAFAGLWIVVFLPLFFLLSPTPYSPVVIFNEYVEKTRFVEVYKGTFYLIFKRLKPLEQSLWKKDIDLLSKKFGYGLTLSRLDQWKGSSKRYDAIAKGEYVFINNEPEKLIKRIDNTPWFVSISVDSAETEKIYRSSKGTLYLLQQEFSLNEKDKWLQKLEDLKNRFSFTLSILDVDELAVPPVLKDKLRENEIIWTPNKDKRFDFYFLLPGKTQVIKAEEIPSTSASPLFIVALLLTFIVIISVAMFLWVSPLWKDLSKLNIIATNFGDGALDERAKITKKSTVSKLAVSFNKMADKIEELFSSQKQLTRAIAHDLRTPLYRLRFAFEMIKSDDASKQEKATYFEAIDTSINDLDQLINQTLLLSRYTSTVDLKHFNLTNLAQKIQYEVDCFALEMDDISIELEVDTPLLEQPIYIDKSAMIRAINNLIANASRYAASKISIHFYQDELGYAISVEDDGCGIPSSEWEKVFTPFAQIGNEQRDGNGGHGLGLAIVKQIMQWHNGEVNLSDSALGGAKFILSWPLESNKKE